ncbi:MAG: hypothetical protein IKN12_06795 [Selenomonadaceae bacterium]|nr:hypothetical protein [Selenomonadaceae bacterium]
MAVILGILIACLVVWRLYIICKMIWTYDFFVGLVKLVIALLCGRIIFIMSNALTRLEASQDFLRFMFFYVMHSFLPIALLAVGIFFLLHNIRNGYNRKILSKLIPLSSEVIILLVALSVAILYNFPYIDRIFLNKSINDNNFLLYAYVSVTFLIKMALCLVIFYIIDILFKNLAAKLSLKRMKVGMGYGIAGAVLLFVLGAILMFFMSYNHFKFFSYAFMLLPVLLVAVVSKHANVTCAVLINICFLGLIAFKYDSGGSFDDGMDFDAGGSYDYTGDITVSSVDVSSDFGSSSVSNNASINYADTNFSTPSNSSGMEAYMQGDGTVQSVMVNSVGDTTTISDLSGGLMTCLNDGTILNSLGIADGRIDMSNMSNIKIFDANNQLAFTMENNVIFDKLHQVAYTIQDGTLFDANHKLVAKLMS